MELNKPKTNVYEFGEFRLIPSERVLFKADEPVSMPPKVFDALVLLVKDHGG